MEAAKEAEKMLKDYRKLVEVGLHIEAEKIEVKPTKTTYFNSYIK
jgi:hypothetical protein